MSEEMGVCEWLSLEPWNDSLVSLFILLLNEKKKEKKSFKGIIFTQVFILDNSEINTVRCRTHLEQN